MRFTKQQDINQYSARWTARVRHSIQHNSHPMALKSYLCVKITTGVQILSAVAAWPLLRQNILCPFQNDDDDDSIIGGNIIIMKKKEKDEHWTWANMQKSSINRNLWEFFLRSFCCWLKANLNQSHTHTDQVSFSYTVLFATDGQKQIKGKEMLRKAGASNDKNPSPYFKTGKRSLFFYFSFSISIAFKRMWHM